jgi:hypothetical protein
MLLLLMNNFQSVVDAGAVVTVVAVAVVVVVVAVAVVAVVDAFALDQHEVGHGDGFVCSFK